MVYGYLFGYVFLFFVWVVGLLVYIMMFKSCKVELCNQVYGVDIEDLLYVLVGLDEGYVLYYVEYFEEVLFGR